MTFKEMFFKINRNTQLEQSHRRREKNMQLAKFSVMPQLQKRFFYLMMLLSPIFAFGEYYDSIRLQSSGLLKDYHISTSIQTALVLWIIFGVIVLLLHCYILTKARATDRRNTTHDDMTDIEEQRVFWADAITASKAQTRIALIGGFVLVLLHILL